MKPSTHEVNSIALYFIVEVLGMANVRVRYYTR